MRRIKTGEMVVAVVVAVVVVAIGMASTSKPESKVVVEVVDSGSRSRVAGARVFVLSDQGKELASAWTDQSGRASLSTLSAEMKPMYLLVDHPNFFISGLKWMPGRLEYYVLVQLLAVK